MSPKAGDQLSAVINVRNLAAADAAGGKVTWAVLVDGRQTGQGEIPVSVKASGSTQLSWRGVVPSGNQLVLRLSIVLSGDANTGNNNAQVAVSIAK
jgi:hypothetical protein